jgi:3-oxoacyl-[acyl-carrier-protein] synthase-3
MEISRFGFGRFVGLDEKDAPQLLQRMSKEELRIDGERYGVMTRMIARPGATVVDLGVAVTQKLLRDCGLHTSNVGALVLSSRIGDVEQAAAEIVARTAIAGQARGIERACSGFAAATQVGLELCRETLRPIVVVAAEIISGSINWESAAGNLADHRRARGQASKLFGDGAAAVLIQPQLAGQVYEILDAWFGDVADDEQLIQKMDVVDSVDPWGHVREGTTGCISMPGRRGLLLVRRAPQIMADSMQRSLRRARGKLAAGEEIRHVVPHQANGLILQRLQSQLATEAANPPKVWDCVENCGNTVSASIPLAMAEVQNELTSGVIVAMPSVGAGGPGYRPDVLSTGCVLVKTANPTNEPVT